MPKEVDFSLDDCAICKRCYELFSFKHSYLLTDGLKFPTGDVTSIKAKCPKCFCQSFYFDNDIIRSKSSKDKDELIKELRNKISQLESDKEFLKNRLEDIIKDKIKDIANTQNNLQIQQQQTSKNMKFDHIA